MEATLDAVSRDGRGKNEARRLRAAGHIPAVVYGRRDAAVSVAVDPKVLFRILHSGSGMNTLIGLKLPDGGEARVLVKAYQLDPITHRMLHVDFYRIAMDEVIRVTVPIVLTGEARGVKQQGGLLDFTTREIDIECLPGDIPEHIDVDVSELVLNEAVRLRDLPAGSWKPVTDPDTMIVHVIAPRTEEAAAEEGLAAQAEPEIIKRGKTEKEEEG